MTKVRVYKVAERLGMPTHEVMDMLRELGADVKNHMSSIDEDLIELLEEELEYRKRREEEIRKKRERTIVLENLPTLRELARLLGEEETEVLLRLADLNVIPHSKKPLPPLVVERLLRERGFEVEWKGNLREEILKALEVEKLPRPPVVTILGHVDHGKTTLLDAIRRSRVAESEFGGITQKIGAYQVDVGGRKITFIDTPGHEAFTTMRARGAQVTDIAVLVVAADDGVMPQTIEAIQHAKAADVPIVVAINKIDKPGANPDRVKQQLSEHGLIPEEWGGDTICVPISALQRKGIQDLLDMLLLQADLLELRARYSGPAIGVIIESRLDRGKGPVATVIVQEGTLRVGDFFVAGTTWGRVRSLFDDLGKPLKEATPATPVEVAGFSELPPAGTKLVVVEEEKVATVVAERRKERERERALREAGNRVVSLEELLAPEEGKVKELHLVLKADYQGSLEALERAISQLGNENVRINVVFRGVGNISEADVMLASASSGVVIGFNVKLPNDVAKVAKQEGVEVRLYRIIYDVVEDMKRAIQGLLEPKKVEEVIGRAEVRALFKIPRVGIVAGCYVLEGKIDRSAFVRVLRKDEVLADAVRIASLKRFKDDVKEVAQGYECGIALEGFESFAEGDILEAYVVKEKR
ncbi:MAG: translation initiation factor IF-2 [Candidatus Caldatribacterium sp.]|nr:translation initiation factor IF-2 [Candidatus Caldatribacterium sp.]